MISETLQVIFYRTNPSREDAQERDLPSINNELRKKKMETVAVLSGRGHCSHRKLSERLAIRGDSPFANLCVIASYTSYRGVNRDAP